MHGESGSGKFGGVKVIVVPVGIALIVAIVTILIYYTLLLLN